MLPTYFCFFIFRRKQETRPAHTTSTVAPPDSERDSEPGSPSRTAVWTDTRARPQELVLLPCPDVQRGPWVASSLRGPIDGHQLGVVVLTGRPPLALFGLHVVAAHRLAGPERQPKELLLGLTPRAARQ
jgi:hypothetical protein